MINIKELLPLHNLLRYPQRLYHYQDIDFVKYPVVLNRFPDEKIAIHDGHHRLVANYLLGKDLLYNKEYILWNMSYEQYMEINLPREWVTPFDPRIHVRIPDFFVYKNAVLKYMKKLQLFDMQILYKDMKYQTAHWFRLINEFGPYMYREDRKVYTLKQLASLYS